MKSQNVTISDNIFKQKANFIQIHNKNGPNKTSIVTNNYKNYLKDWNIFKNGFKE